MGSCVGKSKGSRSKSNQFAFENQVMAEHIKPSGKFTHAIIVGLSDGKIRAITPPKFKPKMSGIKDILDALNGDTSGLESNGLDLGGGTKNNTPGKVEQGKAIYGTDGHSGGCTVFTTKECALIVIYESGTAEAIRLASEVAEHMTEKDH